jgi:uncharacterized protein
LNAIITNNINQIKAICEAHHVKKLYAFGSVVTDDYQFYSDVDLLVDFENEEENNEFSENFFWLRENLIYTLKKPIDLLFYKKALNSKIKTEIEAKKVLIYG